MVEIIRKKMKRRKLQKKQPEKKNVIYLNKELTLQNVIKTQEQADFFMKMLKALQQ
jgi:hypothetical protein